MPTVIRLGEENLLPNVAEIPFGACNQHTHTQILQMVFALREKNIGELISANVDTDSTIRSPVMVFPVTHARKQLGEWWPKTSLRSKKTSPQFEERQLSSIMSVMQTRRRLSAWNLAKDNKFIAIFCVAILMQIVLTLLSSSEHLQRTLSSRSTWCSILADCQSAMFQIYFDGI